jgi:hypothetical protein
MSQGEQGWGLKELLHSPYPELIRRDTYKPDNFNLLKREDSWVLGQRTLSEQQGLDTVTLAGRRKQVAWSKHNATVIHQHGMRADRMRAGGKKSPQSSWA